MKLVDLEPKWIHTNLFVFRCPHCRDTYLSCKNMKMGVGAQVELFEREFGEGYASRCVPAECGCSWSITGDFAAMTVSPSIDASRSGHWHGHIQNGQIVGGI